MSEDIKTLIYSLVVGGIIVTMFVGFIMWDTTNKQEVDNKIWLDEFNKSNEERQRKIDEIIEKDRQNMIEYCATHDPQIMSANDWRECKNLTKNK